MSFVSLQILTSHYKRCLDFKILYFHSNSRRRKGYEGKQCPAYKTHQIEVERLHLQVCMTSINNRQFQKSTRHPKIITAGNDKNKATAMASDIL